MSRAVIRGGRIEGRNSISVGIGPAWGRATLNLFGLKLCQEHNVATSNPAFAHELKRELFEEDFTHCYELSEPVSVEWMDFLADFVLEGI